MDERTVQTSDYAEINKKLYEIVLIDGLAITVIVDGEKIVLNPTSNGDYYLFEDKVNFTAGFTGNKITDLKIISLIDDQSLENLCSVSLYHRSLCTNEELWKRKLVTKFGEKILEYVKSDYEKSYKDYLELFKIWRERGVRNDEILIYVLEDFLYYGEPHKNYPMAKFLIEEKGVKPRFDSVNWLYKKGEREMFKYLLEKGFFPSEDEFSDTIKKRDIEIFKLFIGRASGPLWSNDLEDIIENGSLEMVKYTFENAIFDEESIDGVSSDKAAKQGNIKIVKYLAEQKILPSDSGLGELIKRGDLSTIKYVFKFLEQVKNKNEYEYESMFYSNLANIAAEYNQLEILDFLVSKKINPNNRASYEAARYGHIEMLKHLEKYNVFPDISTANSASNNCQLEVIKYLKKRDILPDRYGFVLAVQSDCIDILKYLEPHNPLSDQEIIDEATDYGSFDIVKYMVEEKRINPSEQAIDQLIGNANYSGDDDVYNYHDTIGYLKKNGIIL